MTVYQALHTFQFIAFLLSLFLTILIHAYKNNVKKLENIENEFAILEAKCEHLKDKLKEYESKADTL